MSSCWCGGMEIQVHCQRLNRICFSRYAYSMKPIDGSVMTSDMSWRDRVKSYGPLVSSCIRSILSLILLKESNPARWDSGWTRGSSSGSQERSASPSPVPENRIIRGSDRRRGERSGLSERERAEERQRGREENRCDVTPVSLTTLFRPSAHCFFVFSFFWKME